MPHIAGEIFIGGLPAHKGIVAIGGVFEDHAGQVGNDLFLAHAGELRHERQIHLGPFPDGNGQSFGGGIDGSDAALLPDGAFGEHIGFALKVAVIVQHLQRTQEVVGGIIGERQLVAPAADAVIFSGKGVVEPVQLRLLFAYRRVRGKFVHLQVDKLMHAVPQLHHAPDALYCGIVQAGAHHAGVFPIVDLAVHKCV